MKTNVFVFLVYIIAAESNAFVAALLIYAPMVHPVLPWLSRWLCIVVNIGYMIAGLRKASKIAEEMLFTKAVAR